MALSPRSSGVAAISAFSGSIRSATCAASTSPSSWSYGLSMSITIVATLDTAQTFPAGAESTPERDSG